MHFAPFSKPRYLLEPTMLKKLKMILVSSMLLFCAATLPADAETITLVADEWPPFNSTPDKQPEGYMVDIAREVFKAHGIKVVYQIVPWKRALEGTRKGEYTAAIGPTKDEASYLVFPKEELARNRLSFWVKKGNPWRFKNRDSIRQISLGVAEGYDYRQWLNVYARNNRNDKSRIQFVSGTNPMDMNLRKLMAGRIGAVVDNEAVIRYTAKQHGLLESIALAGYDTEPAYCYIAFSPANPRSPEYARILSEGIVKLRKNGGLKKNLAVYGLKDWKE
jgi:polar amino acid transport system substrate-binding protein